MTDLAPGPVNGGHQHRTAASRQQSKSCPRTGTPGAIRGCVASSSRVSERTLAMGSPGGHATAAETLDTYSHLWPDADNTTRTTTDSALEINPAADTGQNRATSNILAAQLLKASELA